ncbi:hypothetical protein KP509_25G069600 [Ceratopteris richardii]|uniref:Uncharacterized protein n=1 Tax=Ceratopteris richardii TaxID=49495 RepID=A0A8T2RTQ1_CERRI|nr:hypothetical protein KP509_25G069600 [Ceratopteris richardii]KAH7299017.1 hypothetical protein KP509_25G069600 [Ceratopteris richardii]
MGAGRGSKSESVKRAFRTVFFMVIMVASLLVSSLPLLVSLVDVIAPCVLLSTFTCCRSCFKLHHDWETYSFRTSLMDIPLVSLVRSLIIFCVYSVCGLPTLTYGVYVGVAGACGGLSAIFLVVKACVISSGVGRELQNQHPPISHIHMKHLKNAWGVCLLFSCSMALALIHIMVAYKVKWQAQRKMQLYRFDPESVNGLSTYLPVRGNEKHRRLLIEDGWDGSPVQKDLTMKFLSNAGKPST